MQLFNLQEYNYFPPKFLAFCEIPQYSIVYLGVIGGGIQIGDVSRKEFGLDFSSLRFVRQIRRSCWGVLILPFSHNKNLTNFVHIIVGAPVICETQLCTYSILRIVEAVQHFSI